MSGSVRVTLTQEEVEAILNGLSLAEASAQELNEGEEDPFEYQKTADRLSGLLRKVAHLRQAQTGGRS